jgi:hypothetical protein
MYFRRIKMYKLMLILMFPLLVGCSGSGGDSGVSTDEVVSEEVVVAPDDFVGKGIVLVETLFDGEPTAYPNVARRFEFINSYSIKYNSAVSDATSWTYQTSGDAAKIVIYYDLYEDEVILDFPSYTYIEKVTWYGLPAIPANEGTFTMYDL